jgi:hypothetical protein
MWGKWRGIKIQQPTSNIEHRTSNIHVGITALTSGRIFVLILILVLVLVFSPNTEIAQ